LLDVDATLTGVRAVAEDETWAVGTTTDPDTGRGRALLARWHTDFEWVPAVKPEDTEDVVLTDVAGAGGDVWVVGSVSDGTSGVRPRTELYRQSPDGIAGKAVPCPSDGECALYGVAMVAADDGWAVGGAGSGATFVAHWDGDAWTPVPSPGPGTLSAVAARAADDVWAVGHRADRGQLTALVLHWDGVAWREVAAPASATGNDELVGVAVAGTDVVWVVGRNTSGKPVQQVGTAWRRDGSAWVAQKVFGGVTEFSGVSARSENDVWLSGYTGQDPEEELAHVEHWDGKELTVYPSGHSTNGDIASALEAITVEPGRVVAVGWRMVAGWSVRQPGIFLAR
jgi:hypothetical protein